MGTIKGRSVLNREGIEQDQISRKSRFDEAAVF
jgi:hypothetical protein